MTINHNDANATPAFPTGTILGYPRIGRRRELKKLVEAFWAKKIGLEELEQGTRELRLKTLKHLADLGLTESSAIPQSFSFYDQVLDTTVAVGAIPARFEYLRNADGKIELPAYFTIARGDATHPPVEMTKWFDTNYHYSVPEIGPETSFSVSSEALIEQYLEARDAGYQTRPYLIGPISFLLLAKPSANAPEGFDPLSRLDGLLSVYAELLKAFSDAGADWIQLDESALVSDSALKGHADVDRLVDRAYQYLGLKAERPQLFVSSSYHSLCEYLAILANTPVEAIGVDLVKGELSPTSPDAPLVQRVAQKTLVAGVIDGHNIWRGDLQGAFDTLTGLKPFFPKLSVSSSTSLFHLPHDVEEETKLDPRLKNWLAFADQKVRQIVSLRDGLLYGEQTITSELNAASAALQERAQATGVLVPEVRERTAALKATDFDREPFADRQTAQDARFGFPALPTTTIGSFPQTTEIRQSRARWAKGELSDADYAEAMRQEVREVIKLQEEIGLDVLVHGEPERNDMVQYFAEQLEGFAVTEHGWVQSYGSRCTRPSLLWGDVSRQKPMTVEWATFAQSLTDKPVKGMLTGPVTILAWSFVRDDIPVSETANQVALALRDEIHDLEDAGIAVIQVDEPALRELLPLKTAEQEAYLNWSVNSFRLATAGVNVATQIHTHLCYSEFGEVIGAIDRLDADVTSIEAARSSMEVVADINEWGFKRGIGPGIYDIHSPRIPSNAELENLLKLATLGINPQQLWVNPDCGLKTRGYPETIASLKNMVEATKHARAALNQ